MILAAITTAVENTTEVPVAATDSMTFDILAILSTIGDIGSIGVAALAIILILCAIRSNIFSKDSLSKVRDKCVCDTVVEEQSKELTELKPILFSLVQSVEKISGNDLSHIQEKIENLGKSMSRIGYQVEELEDKIDTHDRQALVIKGMVESTEKNIDEIRQILSRTAAQRSN